MWKNGIIISGIVLVFIGLSLGLLAAVAYTPFGYNYRRIARDSERVTATVTNIGWVNRSTLTSGVYIVYEVDGMVIHARYRTTSRTHVDILVSSHNPSEFVGTRTSYLVDVWPLLGLTAVFVGVGLLLLVKGKRRWLNDYGTPAMVDTRSITQHFYTGI